jgi:hypothetical protein
MLKINWKFNWKRKFVCELVSFNIIEHTRADDSKEYTVLVEMMESSRTEDNTVGLFIRKKSYWVGYSTLREFYSSAKLFKSHIEAELHFGKVLKDHIAEMRKTTIIKISNV